MSALRKRQRKRYELNLIPLIDVLVMLVFFAFVTMQFRSATTLNVTLPEVKTAGKNEFKGTVTITISKEGIIAFNGTPANHDELNELLKQVRNVDKDTPVLIRADEDTPLKTLTQVMDACRSNGLNKFSLQSR